jgi:DNA-binding PadR family transcriptional regulator
MENKMCTEIRRVFLKYIVLKIIKDKPTHGYNIIKTITLRSKGCRTPSTGSIYPILESLESNGLIQSKEMEERRRKVYSITYQGIVALDHMTQKRLELLDEMSQIINIVTEGNDSSDTGDEVGNIRSFDQQPEKAYNGNSQNLQTDDNRR